MKVFAFILIMGIVIQSCYSPRYIYTPATQNIPLINKKGQVEAALYYAGSADAFKAGNYNHGLDIQTAWAVTNHFALMLNETVRNEKNSGNDSYYQNDSSFLSYKRNFTELAAGYFGFSKRKPKMQFQVFGGLAFGSSKIYDDYISNNIQTNKYHKSDVVIVFIQPAFTYAPAKQFLAALSSRFTEIIFKHIRTNYTPVELDNYILDSIAIAPVFFWEPAMSYSFSLKKTPLTISLQGAVSILLNRRFVEYRSTNIALGIVYLFSKFKKSKVPAFKN